MCGPGLRFLWRVVVLVCVVSGAAVPGWAMTFEQAMAGVDVRGRYLFYLHDPAALAVPVSPSYGEYRRHDIVARFEDRGLTVIDDAPDPANASRSAAAVVTRVRALMRAGVPAGNITVAGFSGGGHVALLVSSSLGDPRVGYVILAGCGTGRDGFAFGQFLKMNRGARLRGRMLSVLAAGDMAAGSCRAAAEQASGGGLVFEELRIRSGLGHGLFYRPLPEWVAPVAAWAMGGSAR
jgi:hypothetical protein